MRFHSAIGSHKQSYVTGPRPGTINPCERLSLHRQETISVCVVRQITQADFGPGANDTDRSQVSGSPPCGLRRQISLDLGIEPVERIAVLINFAKTKFNINKGSLDHVAAPTS